MLGLYHGIMHANATLKLHNSITSLKLWYNLVQRLKTPSERLAVIPGDSSSSNTTFRFNMTLPNIEKQRHALDSPWSLLDLFSETMLFESTDPRDKLFAFLGLFEETKDSISPLVSPGYSKSESQVYVDFTWRCTKQSKNISMLETVSRAARHEFIGSDCPMVTKDYPFPPAQHPAWVLWPAARQSWTAETGYGPIHRRHAISSLCEIDIDILDIDHIPGQLPLRGIELDEIRTVVPFVFKDYKASEAIPIDREPPHICQYSLHVIWRTILEELQRLHSALQTLDVSGSEHDSDANAKLFDNFLLIIICQDYLPEERYALHLSPNHRVLPSLDEDLM